MISGAVPMISSLARQPLFSTQALVANVVERDRLCACLTSLSGREFRTLAIPVSRSGLVVSVLPEARIFRVFVLYMTASVQVPPVSIPIEIIVSNLYGRG